MRSLEKAPSYSISPDLIEKSLQFSIRKDIKTVLKKIESDYLYWDKVKYLPLPANVKPTEIWLVTKFERDRQAHEFFIGGQSFHFLQTMDMQKTLWEIDTKYSQSFFGNASINDSEKKQYLVSSIMEEAISSSQIEGAVTTRAVAKEMLRQERQPISKSEQMIVNNYKTIQFIREIQQEPLTIDHLLKIQFLITQQTLKNTEDQGRFRTNDDISVVDSADNEIVYQPPSIAVLSRHIKDLCKFFNEDSPSYFIHPVAKASIIHFMVGYIHPFVDGNGRTARALFYWFLLKKGYWLTEYLSISSAIKDSRNQYYKAYLYCEMDDNDLTYFINYKIKVLQGAYKKLNIYLERKQLEKKNTSHLLTVGGINERQTKIIQWLIDDDTKIITVKEVEVSLLVSNQTARNDLQGLENDGWIKSSYPNKKKQVFGRSKAFDKKLKRFRAKK